MDVVVPLYSWCIRKLALTPHPHVREVLRVLESTCPVAVPSRAPVHHWARSEIIPVELATA
jgi:hypothetical protein